MLARLQEKTLDEWQALLVADGGIASHPYQDTQAALDDPDMIANGHSVPMGADGRQLGLLANLTGTPGRVGGPAPSVGEHTAQVLAEAAAAPASGEDSRSASAATAASAELAASAAPPSSTAPTSPAARSARGPRALPLNGITVVEAATIIAAPFAATMLADLGARVIKFEPLEGDPLPHDGPRPGRGAGRTPASRASHST